MSYRFLRYVRQGVAAVIGQREADPNPLPRPVVDVIVGVDQNSTAMPLVGVSLSVYGPADVAGVDTRHIVGRVPAPGTLTAATDAFACIEFDLPDLPWLFTPFAPAAADDTLRPWLCLAVIEKQPGVSIERGAPLPVLTIAAPATLDELPPLAEIHAWAHVQLDEATAADDVLGLLRSAPGRFRSRLISPRRLEGGTTYFACLLPTFEGGRLSGLGQPVTAASGPLQPAWTAATTLPHAIPVFDFWEFGTGEAGGFEDVVRRLEPRASLGPDVGRRVVDASRPGGGIPDAAPSAPVTLALDAALRIVGTPPSTPPAALGAAIDARLEQPDTVGPPRYGRWHAAADRAIGPTAPPWLNELNRDPVRRIAAAMGTQVVQRHQEELMAACWEQAGEILRANQLLRAGDVALAAAERIYERCVVPLVADLSALSWTGPAAGRVRIDAATTVRGAVRASCLPLLTLSGAFRKILRPNGPIGRRLRRSTDVPLTLGPLLERLASGALRDTRGDAAAGAVVLSSNALATLSRRGPRPARGAPLSRALEVVETLRKRASVPGCIPLDAATVRGALLQGLDPRVTVPARVNAQIEMPDNAWRSGSGLGTIMAAPRITTPMYRPLLAFGHDWLLAGIGDIPNNTIAVVEPNTAFIEAYLAGLNHEMSRELLWRGFPTDQRGTVFDRFWAADAADIAEMHTWRSSLGRHSGTRPPAMTVVAVRGDLVRRFPAATIFLHKARATAGGRVPEPTLGAPNTEFPLFSVSVAPDLRFVAFGIPPSTAKGDPATPAGYYIAFEELPGTLRFGPPLNAGTGHQPAAGGADANAASRVKKPFRLFVHADDVLP